VPRIAGTVELHAVHARVSGLSQPLEISGAKIILNPDEVRIENLTAGLGNSSWHGSLTLPRPCGTLAECPAQVDLHADFIATDEMGALLNPEKVPWYRFLTNPVKPGPNYMKLRASGRLSADRVLLHKLPATRFSANFSLNQGQIDLTDVNASVFSGTHIGNWKMDFSAKPPTYNGEGSFQHVALSQLASAMHDGWISGTATATYRASVSGITTEELLSSATANIQVEARDGVMPHLQPANFTGPLQLRRFLGTLTLRRQELHFGESKLSSNDGVYLVTGTASLDRVLNLQFTRSGSRGFNISGTLSTPEIAVMPVGDTQAALKP
jgi:hypothetical protein